MASSSAHNTITGAAPARVGPSLPLRLRKKQDGFGHLKVGGSSSISTYRPQSKPSGLDDAFSVESSSTKNVVVLGGSYGGMHAASVLAQKLPASHRVILIERNSHFNHLYVFPRFSVLAGHEQKAFIPYTSIFGAAPKRRSVPTTLTRMSSSSDRQVQRGRQMRASEAPNGSSSKNILEMGGDVRYAGEGGALSSDEEASHTSDTSSSRKDVDSQTDSLYSTRSSSTTSTSWTDHAQEGVGESDPGNKAMESALLADGAAAAQVEESVGRPAIEVAPLEEAIDQKLDLSGEDTQPPQEGSQTTPDAPDGGIAQGFEDSAPHVVLQASVTKITDSHVIVTPASDKGNENSKLWSIDSLSIPYTHLIYALGSHLPDPLRTVARTKAQGMHWMSDVQRQIKDARRVVLVGGGALGVEFATDIKSVYPRKDVTLIHSRKRLLPNFDERIHEIAKARLDELGVNLVLGERLALTEGCPRGSTTALDPAESNIEDGSGAKPIKKPSDALHSGLKRVRTTGGKEFICDLLMLCTGQQPNSGLMASLSPASVDPHTRLVRVQSTLQVALPSPEEAAPGPFDARPPCGDCDCFLDKKAAGSQLDERQTGRLDQNDQDLEEAGTASRRGRIANVYAIGDVADAFGALNAGYQAWNMADIAAENIVRDIGAAAEVQGQRGADDVTPVKQVQGVEMLHFTPAPNMLKLSLGLGQMVSQGAPVMEVDEQGQERSRPEISIKEDPEDLGVLGVWQFMAGHSTDDLFL